MMRRRRTRARSSGWRGTPCWPKCCAAALLMMMKPPWRRRTTTCSSSATSTTASTPTRCWRPPQKPRPKHRWLMSRQMEAALMSMRRRRCCLRTPARAWRCAMPLLLLRLRLASALLRLALRLRSREMRRGALRWRPSRRAAWRRLRGPMSCSAASRRGTRCPGTARDTWQRLRPRSSWNRHSAEQRGRCSAPRRAPRARCCREATPPSACPPGPTGALPRRRGVQSRVRSASC